MHTGEKRLLFLAATLIMLAVSLWIIMPAFANRGDYGVDSGATPQRLQPTSTRVPPPTATPAPPTATPVPPTPVPPTQDPNCKEGYYLQHAPDGSSGNCVPIGT